VTDIQGQPTKSVFSEKDIEYLKDRVNVTSNPWLKSRYAHILWQEKKHNDYAEQAIDSYIRTIENINPNELHELPNVLAAVVFISVKSKKGKKKIEDLVLSLINEKPIWIKANILSSVLRIKFLVRTHLIEIANSIPKWIEQDSDKS
jgi:hypothetical protein